jgi:HAD superfamily hydrolase (TIGR01509 family)
MTSWPSLIIFDCDGVLVDSELLSTRAYNDILAPIGVQVSDDLWAECVGLKQADIFARIEKACGRSIGQGIRDRLWPRTRELFAAELQPTPGLLDFLRATTVARCVASSSDPERIRFSLAAAGLAPFFGEGVFSTGMVARGKPAPDIYLYAAAQMRVSPKDAVVIEDSAPGVKGATAAAIRAIGYLGGAHVGLDHGRHLIDAGAEVVARDWVEVDRALTSMAS